MPLLGLTEDMADNAHAKGRVVRVLFAQAVEDGPRSHDERVDSLAGRVVYPMEEVHKDGPSTRLLGGRLRIVGEPGARHSQAFGIHQSEVGPFGMFRLL